MLGHAGLGLRRCVGNAVKFTTKPDAISFPPCRTLTCTTRSLAAFVSTFDGNSSLVFPDCNRASLRHHHHHGSPLMASSRGFSTPRESPAADLDVPAESIQGEDEVLENPKPPRNSLVGVVISDKMDKSIVVKVRENVGGKGAGHGWRRKDLGVELRRPDSYCTHRAQTWLMILFLCATTRLYAGVTAQTLFAVYGTEEGN